MEDVRLSLVEGAGVEPSSSIDDLLIRCATGRVPRVPPPGDQMHVVELKCELEPARRVVLVNGVLVHVEYMGENAEGTLTWTDLAEHRLFKVFNLPKSGSLERRRDGAEWVYVLQSHFYQRLWVLSDFLLHFRKEYDNYAQYLLHKCIPGDLNTAPNRGPDDVEVPFKTSAISSGKRAVDPILLAFDGGHVDVSLEWCLGTLSERGDGTVEWTHRNTETTHKKEVRAGGLKSIVVPYPLSGDLCVALTLEDQMTEYTKGVKAYKSHLDEPFAAKMPAAFADATKWFAVDGLMKLWMGLFGKLRATLDTCVIRTFKSDAPRTLKGLARVGSDGFRRLTIKACDDDTLDAFVLRNCAVDGQLPYHGFYIWINQLSETLNSQTSPIAYPPGDTLAYMSFQLKEALKRARKCLEDARRCWTSAFNLIGEDEPPDETVVSYLILVDELNDATDTLKASLTDNIRLMQTKIRDLSERLPLVPLIEWVCGEQRHLGHESVFFGPLMEECAAFLGGMKTSIRVMSENLSRMETRYSRLKSPFPEYQVNYKTVTDIEAVLKGVSYVSVTTGIDLETVDFSKGETPTDEITRVLASWMSFENPRFDQRILQGRYDVQEIAKKLRLLDDVRKAFDGKGGVGLSSTGPQTAPSPVNETVAAEVTGCLSMEACRTERSEEKKGQDSPATAAADAAPTRIALTAAEAAAAVPKMALSATEAAVEVPDKSRQLYDHEVRMLIAIHEETVNEAIHAFNADPSVKKRRKENRGDRVVSNVSGRFLRDKLFEFAKTLHSEAKESSRLHTGLRPFPLVRRLQPKQAWHPKRPNEREPPKILTLKEMEGRVYSCLSIFLNPPALCTVYGDPADGHPEPIAAAAVFASSYIKKHDDLIQMPASGKDGSDIYYKIKGLRSSESFLPPTEKATLPFLACGTVGRMIMLMACVAEFLYEHSLRIPQGERTYKETYTLSTAAGRLYDMNRVFSVVVAKNPNTQMAQRRRREVLSGMASVALGRPEEVGRFKDEVASIVAVLPGKPRMKERPLDVRRGVSIHGKRPQTGALEVMLGSQYYRGHGRGFQSFEDAGYAKVALEPARKFVDEIRWYLGGTVCLPQLLAALMLCMQEDAPDGIACYLRDDVGDEQLFSRKELLDLFKSRGSGPSKTVSLLAVALAGLHFTGAEIEEHIKELVVAQE